MKRHPLILVAAIALAFAATPASALSRLGDAQDLFNMGKKAAEASREMTQEEEIALGRGLAARVLGAAPLVDDAELQRYVNRVGLWLAMQSERPDLPWHGVQATSVGTSMRRSTPNTASSRSRSSR